MVGRLAKSKDPPSSSERVYKTREDAVDSISRDSRRDP